MANYPLCLPVMIEAPTEAVSAVLATHDGVRQLFDNGWQHIFALGNAQITGGSWFRGAAGDSGSKEALVEGGEAPDCGRDAGASCHGERGGASARVEAQPP
jgi:hypothetical protein